jgi:hypothetical protein
MRTRKRILALVKLNHLRAILKPQARTNSFKRYYFTLDANNPEIHEI